MLHITYIEWQKKQALARADPVDLAMMRGQENGAGAHKLPNDMIPMTLKREYSTRSDALHQDSLDISSPECSSPPPSEPQPPATLIAFDSH